MLLRPAPQSDAVATELLEVITPRTNYAAIAAAENLFAALALTPGDAFSLEIAARREARWFAVRAATASARSHLQEQIGVAYPQAGFRRLDLEQYPRSDPAYVHPDEQVATCTLALRAPPYLPLRTFRDGELAAERAPQAAQADPVLGVLGTLGTLPDGWRALAQLVVRPAPDDWCKGYLRLAVEHPLEHERASRSLKASSGGGSSLLVGLLAAGLTAGAAGLQVQAWYEAGEWLPLLGLGAAGLSLPGVAWLAYRAGLFGGRPI
ncbi:MAG TPA: hypothetical protein VGW38_22965, partial [Chloroflexota bacterium]|nr:hypothetical protein [Chloroflexota bacterium]